jgi:hypothetical protein
MVWKRYEIGNLILIRNIILWKIYKFEGFDQLIDSFEYYITKKPENSHKQKSGGVSYTPTNLQFTVGCGFMNYGRVHFYFSTL